MNKFNDNAIIAITASEKSALKSSAFFPLNAHAVNCDLKLVLPPLLFVYGTFFRSFGVKVDGDRLPNVEIINSM